MYVSRHKNSNSKAGPAPLTLSKNLKSNLDVYVQKVRPLFAKKDEEALFVTDSGTAFNPGTIGKRIMEWWRKATGKENVTSTRLRKMHASQLSQADPAAKASAHRLMCHSTKTAETYYMMQNLGDMAAKGHEVLTSNIGLKDTLPTKTPSPQKASSPNKVPEWKGLSEQLDAIDLLFGHIITQNAPLSIVETKRQMSECASLIEFVEDDIIVNKVYKRVKYLQKKHMKDNLESLPDADATAQTSDWVETTSTIFTVSSKRQSWSRQDESALEEAFQAHTRCPCKAIILDILKTTEDLKDIVTRNGVHRTYEKVKNLFKRKTN